MFQGMTKVVSSPHNVRDVIVVEAQLLQVSLALEPRRYIKERSKQTITKPNSNFFNI